MVGQHFSIIHAIQLIAGKDQYIVDVRLFDAANVLTDGVRGSLVPVGSFHRLLGRQDFHKAAPEGIKLVGLTNMAMQTDRVELRQQIDAAQFTVDTVGNRNVNQSIFSRQRNGRLGAKLGEWKQAGSLASAKDKADDIFHRAIRF